MGARAAVAGIGTLSGAGRERSRCAGRHDPASRAYHLEITESCMPAGTGGEAQTGPSREAS